MIRRRLGEEFLPLRGFLRPAGGFVELHERRDPIMRICDDDREFDLGREGSRVDT